MRIRRWANEHLGLIVVIIALLVLLVGILAWFYSDARAATTLLPPGQQCFQTSAGPVSSGSINMYYPGTTTPKPTWQDSGQVSMNTQPIQLDANGCAIMFGVGSYRQQLYDGPVAAGMTSGNLVFDLITTDTSASNETYWAGAATGTPNKINLYDPGWSATPGLVINFKAFANNTGPVTVTILPSNFVAPMVVDSAIGPTPLVGGEIVQNNIVRLVFDNVSNVFHLTNPVSSGGGGGGGSLPVGVEMSCPGFNPPANFMFESGQLLSRSTFATLFAQLTTAQSGNTTSGSPVVTALTDTSQLTAGKPVEGPGIPTATAILSVNSGSQVTLNKNATATGTSLLTFFTYANGDGATTFGLPDRRGLLLYGRNNMGGTAAANLTSANTTNSPNALGTFMSSPVSAGGGGLNIGQAYLPNVALTVGIPGGQGNHAHTASASSSASATTTGSGVYGSSGSFVNTLLNSSGNVSIFGATLATTVSVGTTVTVDPATIPALSGFTSPLGSGVAFPGITNGVTTNWCLKVQ